MVTVFPGGDVNCSRCAGFSLVVSVRAELEKAGSNITTIAKEIRIFLCFAFISKPKLFFSYTDSIP
jgi:hypothetical protein